MYDAFIKGKETVMVTILGCGY